MKNIHKIYDITEIFNIKENIYINSDEEIKEGDWLLKCKNINDWNFKSGELEEKNYSYFAVKCVSLALINPEDKKIVLTDNEDLIKAGVQAIDDEFLEWFVKNPSCEEVEVEKYHGINTSIAEVNAISGDNSLNWQGKDDLRDYKIIIPSEKAKQETLEEAALKWFMTANKREIIFDLGWIKIFEAGAKWQQERMYSEEDMKIAFYANIKDWILFEEFIEQFKNK